MEPKEEEIETPLLPYVTSAPNALNGGPNSNRYQPHTLERLDHMGSMAPVYSHYGYAAAQQTHAQKSMTSSFAHAAYGMAGMGGLAGSTMDIIHPAMASYQSSLGKCYHVCIHMSAPRS